MAKGVEGENAKEEDVVFVLGGGGVVLGTLANIGVAAELA